MTEESVPVTLRGAEYFLRYDQPDVIAVERDTGIGYTSFFDPKYQGLTLTRRLIMRGLRIRNEKGELIYAYPQDDVGLDRAGEFIRLHIADGNLAGSLMRDVLKAFVAGGWFPAPLQKKEPDEKNLQADG